MATREGSAEAGIAAVRQIRRMPWWVEIWTRIVREKPLGAFGGALVVLMVAVAIFAPWISPHDYTEVKGVDRLKPPSSTFILGTDNMGRDLLSRIIWGSRISLYVGLGSIGLSILGSTVLGTVSGYFGGKLDMFIQRVVDAWMAFPGLVLLLTIMSVLGPGLNNVILALGIWGIASSSRIVRGSVLSIKENQYIEAARSLGAGHMRIIMVHILPNVFAPILILATIGLGSMVIAESSLSFLGFGVPPPAPSWGGMLSGASRYFLLTAPWMAIFPGIAISIAVFGFNMLGDALRDVLDPRLRGSR